MMQPQTLLRLFCVWLAGSLLCVLSASLATAENFEARFDAEVRPLLERYCVRCHNHEKKEGELNLARFDNGKKAVGAGVWTAVIQRFSLREMPPEGEPGPTDPERDVLFRWMQGLISADDGNCNKLATDITQHFYRGNVMSRRLTRAEYNHTIRDLVGLDLKPADSFPADGAGGEGFDTNGDALFTNPILMEKYLDAAARVAEAALPDATEGLSAEVSAARHKLLVKIPGEGVSARDAALANLQSILPRAYRRPATSEDVEALLKLFDRSQERGDSFLASLRLAIRGALVSPNFLFLVEPEPEKEGVHELGPFPLASRLSYFLWASMPDDELFGLAESGKLKDPEIMKQQVQRMLADPRTQGMAETFAVQWLGLSTLGTSIRPDGGKFPEFDDALSSSMKGEAVAFVAGVFRENRSLLEFLDADYVMVNERLAQHYGISDVTGPEFRRVALSDRNRGGLVGMAAVHAITAYPLRSSPVLRGKWILSEVLGSKVPPPPPNVPSLPGDDVPQDGISLRQRLEQHRKDAACASCHNRLDPLGFGLENFDPIGRWRTEIAGQPVDASGELPSGEKYNGPAELKQILVQRKQEFLTNLIRKMLGFALGRELNRFDDCVVRDTRKRLEENDYRASVLFESIALSFPFNHRYAKK